MSHGLRSLVLLLDSSRKFARQLVISKSGIRVISFAGHYKAILPGIISGPMGSAACS